MSGIALAQQMILLPRLTNNAWDTVNSPVAGSTISSNGTGTLTASRTGPGSPLVQLNGWIPFALNYFDQLYEAMLTVVSGAAGWTNTGVWRDLSTGPAWDGIKAGASDISVVRFDVRLKNSTPVLATANFTVTFTI